MMKMSVRNKLILIFLSVSVVPLAALTFLSYSNSIRSLRDLVERDDGAAARDLQHRLSNLNGEIERRIAAITRLPALRSLDLDRPMSPEETTEIAEEMQGQVRDRWSLFSGLEFLPARGDAPAGKADPPPGRERSGEPGPSSVRLILPDFSRLARAGTPGEGPAEDLKVKVYSLDFVEGVPTEKTLEVLAGEVMENLVRLPGFLVQTGVSGHRITLRNLGQEVTREFVDTSAQEEASRAAPRSPTGSAGRTGPSPASAGTRPAAMLKRLDELAEKGSRAIALPVHSATGVVGEVVARLRPDRVLSRVFEGFPLGESEIAFAVDPEGRVYAREAADLDRLRRLGLVRGEPAQGPPMAAETDAQALARCMNEPDWITVIQKNDETGYSFGVVRQVSGELRSIRRATLLNLTLGFIFIGLAGSGILVFSGRMTRGLEALSRGAGRLAAGDLDHRIRAAGKDEIGELAVAFNNMAADLAASRRRMVVQERVQRELEIARHIQGNSLPRAAFHGQEMEVFGRSIPSHEVGGDFFNFLPLGAARVALLIGDVSGKGVPAALMMAEVQATIRTLLRYDDDVERVVDLLNGEVTRNKPANAYLTLFLGVLDWEAGILTYVNAGQTPPFLLRAAEGDVVELPPNCRPVGLYEDLPIRAERVEVGCGDLLCLYTDGVVESTPLHGEEFFGARRLEEVVREAADEPLEEVMDRVARRLTGHHGDPTLEDDATMLLVRLKEGKPGKPLPGEAKDPLATGLTA
ncbi:MAG: PP2C family protein-serine/threonine phosphatase [Acidobacteriota bacterium]